VRVQRFRNSTLRSNSARPANADPALPDKFERIKLAQSKIHLLINPADEDHQRLGQTIDLADARLRSEDATEKETEDDIRAIVGLAQSILKREWQRVKLGT